MDGLSTASFNRVNQVYILLYRGESFPWYLKDDLVWHVDNGCIKFNV